MSKSTYDIQVFYMELGNIIITNQTAEHAEIRIEGTIGIPEDWQFDNPDESISTYDKFAKKISEIKNMSAKTADIHISSYGGNVNDALQIFDAVKSLNADVTTMCHGYCASAATIIAQCGNRRKISANSLYLIHNSSATARGNKEELKKVQTMLDKTDERIANIYATASGRDISHFIELMNAGDWLSPQEALDAGLVDEIVDADSVKIANELNPEVYGLPALPQKFQNMSTINQKLSTRERLFAFFNRKSSESPATDEEIEKMLDAKVAEVQNLTAERDAVIKERDELKGSNDTKNVEIDNLKKRVADLETELTLAKVKPTVPTQPNVQDPAPQPQNSTKSANQLAYEADLKAFK